MWFLLNLIPDVWYKLFVHGVVVLGLGLTILSTILRWKLYQIIGILILIIGVFFEGSYTTEMMWRAKVQEVQKKLDEANVKSKKETVKLQKKINAQSQLIKQKAKDNANLIRQNASKIDADCKLNATAIELHNAAASNGKVSGTSKGVTGELPKQSSKLPREDFKIK
jgi:hypothetical protein